MMHTRCGVDTGTSINGCGLDADMLDARSPATEPLAERRVRLLPEEMLRRWWLAIRCRNHQ